MRRAIARGVKAFGHFWWEFLVGDTPELFLATLAVVGIAFALRHERTAAAVTLPVLAALVLLASTWRGRARRRKEPASGD